eukprot:SAG11_NODE_2090_length_3843_cov_4.605502_2_plen_77_part_00
MRAAEEEDAALLHVVHVVEALMRAHLWRQRWLSLAPIPAACSLACPLHPTPPTPLHPTPPKPGADGRWGRTGFCPQ